VERYRVAQAGLGHRGRVHAQAFLSNSDRFDLVALCELDEPRLEEGLAEYDFAAGYTDAERMLAETKPDVFCFVTQPHTRSALVELAAKYGVKGLAFEKPMATSLKQAWTIADLCRRHHIKAVVCHQQKYLTSTAHTAMLGPTPTVVGARSPDPPGTDRGTPRHQLQWRLGRGTGGGRSREPASLLRRGLHLPARPG